MSGATFSLLLAAGGGFDPLRFDPAALILTWLTFIALLAVLTKMGWKPMLASIEAREKRIEDAITKAEKDRETAEHLLAEYQKTIKDVEADVAALKEKGRAEADNVRRDILARAEAEAAARAERALREIDLARAQALEDIRKEAVSIGMAVASKVVGRSLDGEDQKRLAARVVEDLSGVGPGEN